MNKGIFALCAATALGFAVMLLMPAEVTAVGSGMHSFHHSSPIRFFRPFRHHHHHHGFKNWNNWNNGLYAGYGYGGYYMPTYSDGPTEDVTGSVPTTTIIPPPPGLNCQRSRDVVTVPSAVDGSARQITITRC